MELSGETVPRKHTYQTQAGYTEVDDDLVLPQTAEGKVNIPECSKCCHWSFHPLHRTQGKSDFPFCRNMGK